MGCSSSRCAAGKTAAVIGGIGIGAALMYVLDPQGGKRRRALARDKAVSMANKTGRAVAATSRDLGNRAQGVAATIRRTTNAPSPSTDLPKREMDGTFPGHEDREAMLRESSEGEL